MTLVVTDRCVSYVIGKAYDDDDYYLDDTYDDDYNYALDDYSYEPKSKGGKGEHTVDSIYPSGKMGGYSSKSKSDGTMGKIPERKSLTLRETYVHLHLITLNPISWYRKGIARG